MTIEKQEKDKLIKQIEERNIQIHDLEGRLQLTTTELAKKSQKVSQVTSTMSLLQAQAERLRSEIEEERMSTSKEVSHLNAIIAEKTSVIDKLKQDGNFEKDRTIFDTGITLESTNFESIVEGDLDLEFDTNQDLFEKNTLMHGDLPSPRDRKTSIAPRQTLFTQLSSFVKKQGSRRGSNLTPTLEKATQTKESHFDDSQNKTAELISKLKTTMDKVGSLEKELTDQKNFSDMYKRHVQERDATIDGLREKMMSLSEESTDALNDVNREYERAMAAVKALKARLAH